MKKSELYRNDNLRLSGLVNYLGYSSNTVSMILNIHQNENFYQFENRYRIEAAKIVLKDKSRSAESILDIAYESGFRSKSTFNTVFKEYTGTTPSKFRSS